MQHTLAAYAPDLWPFVLSRALVSSNVSAFPGKPIILTYILSFFFFTCAFIITSPNLLVQLSKAPFLPYQSLASFHSQKLIPWRHGVLLLPLSSRPVVTTKGPRGRLFRHLSLLPTPPRSGALSLAHQVSSREKRTSRRQSPLPWPT